MVHTTHFTRIQVPGGQECLSIFCLSCSQMYPKGLEQCPELQSSFNKNLLDERMNLIFQLLS